MSFLAEYAPNRGRGVPDRRLEFGTFTGYATGAVIVTLLTATLSGRTGRKPMVTSDCVVLPVLSIPSMSLIENGYAVPAFLGLLSMGPTPASFSGALPSTLPAKFPTCLRQGSVSIAFNVSVAFFGETVARMRTTLVATTGDLEWLASYLMIAGVIATISG